MEESTGYETMDNSQFLFPQLTKDEKDLIKLVFKIMNARSIPEDERSERICDVLDAAGIPGPVLDSRSRASDKTPSASAP